jgi:uncharacterized protein
MSPLVLDTRDLPRRAGLLRQVSLDVSTPAQMGAGVIVVEQGAPMHLEVRMESVVEGVLVTAEASTTMAGECGHCLEPVVGSIDVEVQELFLYPDQVGPISHGDDPVEQLVDDRADLEPAITDAVVLALPFSRVCDDSCPRLAETRIHRDRASPRARG